MLVRKGTTYLTVVDTATNYTQRILDAYLDSVLEQLSAILVVGPRGSGKTTTFARRASTIIRLDRAPEAAAFRADPDVALRGLEEPVLLDEWQAVPGLLAAVKRAVDADPSPNRIYLTGSVSTDSDPATLLRPPGGSNGSSAIH